MPGEMALANPFVFLSYASVDRERALAIANVLERAGVRIWIDRQAIAGGSSWSAEIVRGIQGCAALLVLCSEAAMRSPNVQRELQLGMEEQRPTIPLLLEPVQQPPEVRYVLAGRQWIELLDRPEGEWLPRLLQALDRQGIATTTHTSSTAESTPARAMLSLSTPPTNLPAALTSFVGREHEIEAITRLLGETRLVTLTGPGGTGKTRLALTVAQQVAAAYLDGVWFVDLSPVTDPALVPAAIARVLDVREVEGVPLLDTLAAYLRQRRLLLLLDNFEQVVEAAAVITKLLTASGGLRLLVTSRILLHAAGEYEYAVPPLPLPDAEAGQSLELIGRNPAVQLFVERARATRPDFSLTADNAQVVSAICARLDGLPLAIELAAARVKLLPPAALLTRLEHRLALLTGGTHGLPERQQTLRGAIQWSYDLLSLVERTLLRRLAVFTGGCMLAAAEAVCDPEDELDVFEGIVSLVDKSLLRQVGGPDDESRFGMLETIREFALERLAASGEEEMLRRRHAEHFVALAEEGSSQIASAAWLQGMQRLASEEGNLQSVQPWAVHIREVEQGSRLVWTLFWFWWIRGSPSEGRRWAEELLAQATPTAAAIPRARCLSIIGGFAYAQGDSLVACTALEEAVAIWRTTDNRRELAWALVFLAVSIRDKARLAMAYVDEAVGLMQELGEPFLLGLMHNGRGVVALTSGDYDTAEAQFSEAISIWRAHEIKWVIPTPLTQLGRLAEHRGQYATAQGLLREAVALCSRVGDRMMLVVALILLARVAQQQGNIQEALSLYQESLGLSREHGNDRAVADTLVSIAALRLAQQDPQAAAQSLAESLTLNRDLDRARGVAVCLAGLAAASAASRRTERAARLGGAASALVETGGVTFPSMHQQFYHETIAAVRETLGDERCAAAWAEGEQLSLDEAIALALATPTPV